MEKIDAVMIASLGEGVEKELKKISKEKRKIFKSIYALRSTYFKERFLTQMDLFNLAREGKEEWSTWKLPNLAGLTITDYLTKSNLNVELVNSASKEKERLQQLLEAKPLTVLLSTTFVINTNEIKKIVNTIKEISPETKVILGGTFVHNLLINKGEQEAINRLKETKADFFIFSKQGEAYLPQLIKTIKENTNLEEIPNLGFKKDNIWKFTFKEEKEFKLDETKIDYSNKKFTHYLKEGNVTMRTSRSCPFNCSFCTYPATAGKYTLTDLKIVRKQFQQLKEQGVKNIFFIDDTFNVPVQRFEKLLDILIEDQHNFKWYSFLRVQYCDEALIEKMAKAGCQGVFLGMESGDENILINMNKQAKVEQFRNTIPLLEKYNIFSLGAFIIGFPGETKETLENTKRFIEESGLTFYFLQEFYYLHNAPIHLEKEKWELEGEQLKWKHKTMNSQEATKEKIKLFNEAKNSIHVDPDMTMWQIGYLLGKGLSLQEAKKAHIITNKMLKLDLEDDPQEEEKKETYFTELQELLKNH